MTDTHEEDLPTMRELWGSCPDATTICNGCLKRDKVIAKAADELEQMATDTLVTLHMVGDVQQRTLNLVAKLRRAI